jgi:tetratricopeptide (TPR) repeat protein
MTPARRFSALGLRAIFLCSSFALLADTPAPPASEQYIATNIQSDRPFQALYQIEYNAAQFGWTADLSRQAGDLWHSLGDVSRAVTHWEGAVRLDPANATLARHLAQGYIALQQWSQAVIALNRVVELNDDNWSHFQLGLLQAAFNPQRAVAHFRLAARDPQFEALNDALSPLLNMTLPDATTVMRIGVILAAYDHWEYAEYVFQYAASLVQPFPEALAYIGLARDRQGKTGTEFINQAVTHAPANAQVRYLQGLHLRLRGDEQGSLEAFQQAANFDPINPAYAAELAFAYQQLGSAVQAEYWFKAAVTVSQNDPRFQKLLDDFYSQTPPVVN